MGLYMSSDAREGDDERQGGGVMKATVGHFWAFDVWLVENISERRQNVAGYLCPKGPWRDQKSINLDVPRKWFTTAANLFE